MSKVKATVHGAISLVNAIAVGKGATLGIDPKVQVIMEAVEGSGINIRSDSQSISSRLISKTIEKVISKKQFSKHKLTLSLNSEIPTGFGLKSSSAISSAVALATAKLFKQKINDSKILLAGVDASIETKVSLTGAYDDACACYYGGFMVTDNYKRKIIRSKKAPTNLKVVIFVPKSRKRGNIRKLKTLRPIFERAWNFAKNCDYWNAMILNGFATSSILGSDPKLITSLVEKGAIGASISGNGPSVAAVTKQSNISAIKKVFSSLEGNVTITQINNKRSEVHEL
ncbi:MAG TPA: shikimate kinase [Nitrosopumilaceae archaeon]|nr:shikimate kinase [Nitrosopumilaceae archaeon]